MSLGIALLVHQDFDRVLELAQALHGAGCKLGIHVDAKVDSQEYEDFHQQAKGMEGVVFAPRIQCEWGRFSLVEAQISAARAVLDGFADVSHVAQLSGSCLPNRPVAELQDFLQRNPDTDFIESVRVGGVSWIKGGLEAERFSLYFPFSFVKHRRRFDAFVWLQRKLGINRKLPEGLVPHIGSQWWVLTRATLQAILNDPERAQYDRFFAKCWIPDESYFQSLVRKHSARIKSRSLTWARFDFRGKPMVFYDDHIRYVEHLNSFFLRKVWPGATALYQTLLDQNRQAAPRNPDMAVAFDAYIQKAESRWLDGRAGLTMQSCAPVLADLTTAAPYTVLSGFNRVFKDLPPWLLQQTGVFLHEGLFSQNAGVFQKAAQNLKGNMGGSRKIRDHNPLGFLLNLIWNHSDDDPTFSFDPAESPDLARFIAMDENARIFHIRGAWLLDLLRSGERDIGKLGPLVEENALIEQAQLEALARGRARVQVISLTDIYTQPGAVLEGLVFSLRPALSRQNRDLPAVLPYEGLEDYVEFLRDAGLNLQVEFEGNAALAREMP